MDRSDGGIINHREREYHRPEMGLLRAGRFIHHILWLHRSPEDPNIPLPLTMLRQALIVAFKEAFPLARDQEQRSPQSLDATGIQLNNAYLRGADLKQVWMPRASCREANLNRADLSKADLSKANLWRADLSETKLSGAKLSGANLSEANLSEANIEDAQSLKGANLRGVIGLTKEQLEACKAKGAIIDEDTTTSAPQPTVAPALSPQSNYIQAPSAPATQGSTPTPSTDESSAAYSKPGPQS